MVVTLDLHCLPFVALARCEEFRGVFTRAHLPALQTLHLLVCFPAHLVDTFQTSVFPTFDGSWPFGRTGCHLDECLLSIELCRTVTKPVLLFYTLPLDRLLWYTRTLHNHRFAQHSTDIRQRSLQWTCSRAESVTQLSNTLNSLAAGHVSALHLSFSEIKVGRRGCLISLTDGAGLDDLPPASLVV